MVIGNNASISEDERNDSLPLLGITRKSTMIPLMSPDRPGHHRKHFRREEQKRRGDRRQKCSPALEDREGRRGEREPDPFDPLAEVVWVRDVSIQKSMRNRVVFPFLLLCDLFWRLFRVFGSLLPANVEEDLVVNDVADESRCPHQNTEPEARSLVSSCEIGESFRGA